MNPTAPHTREQILAVALVELLQAKEVGRSGRWRVFQRPNVPWPHYLKGGIIKYGPTLKDAQEHPEARVGEFYHLARNMMEQRGELRS